MVKSPKNRKPEHSKSEKSKIETYSTADHAQTFRALTPGPERDTPSIRTDFDILMRDGYVVIQNLLDQGTLEAIKSEAAILLGKTGRNPFEGLQTQRVYNVLSKTRAIDALAEHPRILGLLDRVFEPNFLLSQSQIINIHPGEAAQTLHFDDGFYRIPRPRPALGAATIWAIDDFTEDNGATVIIPGSHEWGEDGMPNRKDTIAAVMPAGSVVMFLGTTWHGGGLFTPAGELLARTFPRNCAGAFTANARVGWLFCPSPLHGYGRWAASIAASERNLSA